MVGNHVMDLEGVRGNFNAKNYIFGQVHNIYYLLKHTSRPNKLFQVTYPKNRVLIKLNSYFLSDFLILPGFIDFAAKEVVSFFFSLHIYHIFYCELP